MPEPKPPTRGEMVTTLETVLRGMKDQRSVHYQRLRFLLGVVDGRQPWPWTAPGRNCE